MTPRLLTSIFAATLPVAAALAGAVVLLSPGAGEMSAALRVAAFYGLSAWSFAAFPRLRRSDLTLIVVVFAAAAEALRLWLGRGEALQGLGWDALGAGAILLPVYLERLRELSRRHGYVAFSALRAQDRRRASGRRPAPQHTAFHA